MGKLYLVVLALVHVFIRLQTFQDLRSDKSCAEESITAILFIFEVLPTRYR